MNDGTWTRYRTKRIEWNARRFKSLRFFFHFHLASILSPFLLFLVYIFISVYFRCWLTFVGDAFFCFNPSEQSFLWILSIAEIALLMLINWFDGIKIKKMLSERDWCSAKMLIFNVDLKKKRKRMQWSDNDKVNFVQLFLPRIWQVKLVFATTKLNGVYRQTENRWILIENKMKRQSKQTKPRKTIWNNIKKSKSVRQTHARTHTKCGKPMNPNFREFESIWISE